MAERLPTVAGDTNTWGTVLNGFLGVAHNSDGALKGLALGGSVSAGATSFLLLAAPTSPISVGQYVVIDAYTSQAEVRKVSSVSSLTVNVSVALVYDHSSGDRVVPVTTPQLTTDLWGCKGDGTTDEQVNLQEAIIQTTVYGSNVWLDGLSRTHVIGQPLIALPNAKIKHMALKAKSTFAPAETNNAMVMTMQGYALSFTAVASTDIFTTSVAHGIPADNIGIVFQGSSLPAGITAGKYYYARDRTTFTFKVSATSGGAAVDLTVDGSGRVFTEVYSLAKSYFEDVFIDGNDVASVNGALISTQQPSYWDRVRIDNCPGVGLRLKGQQHCFTNFESIDCSKAVVLDNAVYMYFFGFNAEGCDRAVYVDTGMAGNCLFNGVHIEMNSGDTYATAASVAIDLANQAQEMTFQNVHISMNTTGQTAFQSADNVFSSYTITDMSWSGGSGVAGKIFVNDIERGVSLDAWTDCRFHISSLNAPLTPTSGSFTDPFPNIVIGPGGRRVAWGSTIASQPSHHIRPGSSQTGNQYQAEDTSGNAVWGVTAGGVVEMKELSDPTAPATNFGRVYMRDNGAGKTQMVVRFPTGAIQVIATEP